jgi:peptide/nickel transport system substrate-binding protein
MDRREVRQALSEAIDRQLVVRTLLAGRATVASGLLPPGHWAAAESPPFSFDPTAARSVLSGLPPLTLLTSTERARLTVARALAQMLTDCGLDVRVVPLDLGVLLERLDRGDFTLAVLQIPELTEPNVLSWFFHPGGVPGEGGVGRNRARYRNREVGRLLDHASREPERSIRRADYLEIARQLRRDLPVIPLWHEQQFAVVSPRAASFVPSAEGRWGSLAQLP